MKPAYVVRWQSPTMPAPAFWYYGRYESAITVARDLRNERVQATVAQVEVSDHVRFLDATPDAQLSEN